MDLIPTKNHEKCILLAKESMRPYFVEHKIPWDFEKRLKLYSSFEMYEVIDNQLVGYIALREIDGGIYIADIQILEEFRNKGYGTRALKIAKEMAKNKGCPEINLKVFKNSPAVKLYERNGYIKIAEENYVFDSIVLRIEWHVRFEV